MRRRRDPLPPGRYEPELRPIDKRVLEALDFSAPRTQSAVARALYPVSRRSVGATAEQEREVGEILRGLEAVGKAARIGVFWTRAGSK